MLHLRLSRDCLLKRLTTVDAVKKHRIKKMELRTSPAPSPSFITPSWFSASSGLALHLGNWRNELLHRAGDIERHPGKRALSLRGRDVLVQDVLPTTAQRYGGAVAEFENICESETSMGSKSSSITVSMNWVISAFNIFEPFLRQGPSNGDKAGTLISGL